MHELVRPTCDKIKSAYCLRCCYPLASLAIKFVLNLIMNHSRDARMTNSCGRLESREIVVLLFFTFSYNKRQSSLSFVHSTWNEMKWTDPNKSTRNLRKCPSHVSPTYFRGPIYKVFLRQSYDYLTIMPKLRSTYDGRLFCKTSYEARKAFLRYDSLAKL